MSVSLGVGANGFSAEAARLRDALAKGLSSDADGAAAFALAAITALCAALPCLNGLESLRVSGVWTPAEHAAGAADEPTLEERLEGGVPDIAMEGSFLPEHVEA